MKQIFKIFLLVLMFLFATVISAAQGKNSLRIGAGINMHSPATYIGKSAIGPSLFAEYAREINKYFSAEVDFHTDVARISKTYRGHDFGLSFRVMTSPLAFVKWLEWIEIGVGISCDYRRDTKDTFQYEAEDFETGEKEIFYHLEDVNKFFFGFDFPLRVYALNNDKFELFAFYEFKTAFLSGGKFGWHYSTAGISFGVKF